MTVKLDAQGRVQCQHCRGDYKLKKDGQMFRHSCWAYRDGQMVFGPLDKHGRHAK